MWVGAAAAGVSRRLWSLVTVAALTSLLAGIASAEPAARASGPQPRCAVATKSGEHRLPVHFAGRNHRVLVHLPERYTGKQALPLVLDLHGSTHDGASQLRLSQFGVLADERNFVVVAPNGAVRLRRGYTWNVPGVPLAGGRMAPASTRNDVNFLAATLRAASAAYCIDPRRVYVTGHSAGARMASALACRRADLIAALGAVSGLRAGPADSANPRRPDPAGCLPSRPVPVLSLHGALDKLNPYGGGGSKYWSYSVPAAVRAWQRIDGCAAAPRVTQVRAHVTIQRFQHCAEGADVVAYQLHDGGHTWPGSRFNDPVEVSGPTNYEVSASRTIWSFFASHQQPKRPQVLSLRQLLTLPGFGSVTAPGG